jgi:hypothetical protein
LPEPADPVPTPTAEGEIDETFMMKGRGWVLILKEGFRGTIFPNGIVECDGGSAPYVGPELGHRKKDGVAIGFVAVMIGAAMKE